MLKNFATITLIALLWVVAAPSAQAMYSSTLGCFINRDPGVGLDSNGRPTVTLQTSGRSIQRDIKPYAGRGYQNGMSLYRGYFVPNKLDPTGEETKEFDFMCAKIKVNIEGTRVQIDAKLTKAEGCCECEKVVPKQWWQFGHDGEWREDNAETKTPFYNYDPVTDKFIKGFGGDGQILDSPSTGWPGMTRTWKSCFYCKTKSGYTFLGCVEWSLFGKNHPRGFSIDPVPTTLPPGAGDPYQPPTPASDYNYSDHPFP